MLSREAQGTCASPAPLGLLWGSACHVCLGAHTPFANPIAAHVTLRPIGLTAKHAAPSSLSPCSSPHCRHIPPEAFEYTHGTQETFYYEETSPFDSGWQDCSFEDGEDAKCADGQSFPVSVDDHLAYLGYPISRMC